MEIRVERIAVPKQKPDETNLGFGKYYTDHMFVMDYDAGQGWHDARIVPYGPIPLEPTCVTLHYAQETFEGLKAYRRADGKVQLLPAGDERPAHDQFQPPAVHAGIPGGDVCGGGQGDRQDG